jgi:hypothetical protein
MKITATDTVGSLGTVTLGDESATATGFVGPDVILDPPPLPVERRQAQIEPIAFGARVFAAGRGNAETSFSWTVQRAHNTQDLAGAFVFEHAALVPLTCSLQVYLDDGTEHVYSAGYIVEIACLAWNNISTVFRYSIKAATPPTS